MRGITHSTIILIIMIHAPTHPPLSTSSVGGVEVKDEGEEVETKRLLPNDFYPNDLQFVDKI